MKTDYELLKSPAFWRPLGCELESIKMHGAFEIATIKDLLCHDSFTLAVNDGTVNDIYRALKLKRRKNMP